MNYETLHAGNGDKLILFFNGWAVSTGVIARLEPPPGATVAVVSGYTRLEPLPAGIDAFREKRLVAWSTGVWAAGRVCGGYRWESAVAVNGTPYPCDDRRGIPEAIFRGTWEGLTAGNLRRFYRRVGGIPLGADETTDGRSVESLREELRRIGECSRLSGAPDFPWTRVYLSENDRIFPFAPMEAYWRGRGCPVVCLEAPHNPFSRWRRWEELWS